MYSIIFCLQGPYDTAAMLHGCNSLEGGRTILTLDIGVNCSSFVAFSRQILSSLKLSSCPDCAVSVQKPSGTILGCGKVETFFPVKAGYRGKITFRHYSPYFPSELARAKSGILKYNVLEGIAGTLCSTSAIFEPWSPSPKGRGWAYTSDQSPVGDLSMHQVVWLFGRRSVIEVPLIGSATILGHMVWTI